MAFLALAAVGAMPGLSVAKGWEEVHQTSDDVRVAVAPDGAAIVTHHLRYRVVAGHFKTLELAGLDPRAELIGETMVLPEKGGEIPARIEANPKTAGAVRIAYDEPKGLGRGVYVVNVKYKIDLVATKMLVRDGAMWRLSWTAPPSPEGHDGARIVFELPSAPTEPRLASSEQAATTLATLRREPERDELELLRAHVPRGEAVTWSARVDPKAFPRVVSAELRSPTAAVIAAVPVPDHVPAVLIASALAVLAGALAFALRTKQTLVARACEGMGVQPRLLLPVRWGLGPFLYGAVTAGALASFLWGSPAYGAVLAVIAMAVAVHTSPSGVARPRGPGRWQPIADADVLVKRAPTPAPGDVLDIGTRRGKLAAFATVLVLAALAFLLRTRVAGVAVAIPLTAAALVPLFLTGTRAQLPRTPAELAARLLAPARDLLGRLVDLAHVEVRCLARFGEGSTSYDEVRLSCAPTDRIPGLRSIELALAGTLPGAPTALPEVLVRFDDGSPAASKIAQLAPGIRVVPGRSPEEKVLRLSPRVSTPSGAARLLARLSVDLEGKRVSDRMLPGAPPPRARRFAGIERRLAALSVRAAST